MKFDWKFALAGVLGASLSFTAAANDAVTCPTTAASYRMGGDAVSADCAPQASCSIAADVCCDGEIVPFELFPETSSGVKIGGWTQVGYHNKSSLYDLFNQYPNHVALHQQWLYAERVADGSCGWDWGFRIDAMYGIDADNTQSFGNAYGKFDFSDAFTHGEYGFAIPQVYVEVANGDLSIIAGHFYTLIGYEVVTAPDNFFYSHAWTMNNSEPFTHTGALATYQVDDRLTAYGGWTLGWDTGFNQFNNGSSFLGGFLVRFARRNRLYLHVYGGQLRTGRQTCVFAQRGPGCRTHGTAELCVSERSDATGRIGGRHDRDQPVPDLLAERLLGLRCPFGMVEAGRRLGLQHHRRCELEAAHQFRDAARSAPRVGAEPG
jgi:hypothetical protein